MRYFAKILLFSTTILFIGCREKVILQDLSQIQANSAVASLVRSGVGAYFERSGSSNSFAVVIDENDYSRASLILDNIPHWKRGGDNFDKLTESSSLFPSSREMEALKLDLAQSVKLRDLFLTIPGVETAEVNLRINSANKNTGPSATILLVGNLAKLDKASLLQMAQSSVPEVLPEQIFIDIINRKSDGADLNVAVKMIPFPFPFVSSLWVAEESRNKLVWVVVGWIIGSGLIFGTLGFLLGTRMGMLGKAFKLESSRRTR